MASLKVFKALTRLGFPLFSFSSLGLSSSRPSTTSGATHQTRQASLTKDIPSTQRIMAGIQPPVVIPSAEAMEIDTPTPPPAPEPKPTIVMAARGDLIITCGVRDKDFDSDPTGRQEYKVSAAALANASPVFDRMLFGHFSEAQAESRQDPNGWRISLPEDHDLGMTILLGIAHACFEHVPTDPPSCLMYRVAILADKYKMTHLLRPYARGWIAGLKKHLQLIKPHLCQSLYIAYQFGEEDLFVDIVKRLALETWLAADGRLTFRVWRPGPSPKLLVNGSSVIKLDTIDHLGPPDTEEHLMNIRSDILMRFASRVNDMIMQRSKIVDKRCCTVGNDDRGSDDVASLHQNMCDSMVLGHLQRCCRAWHDWGDAFYLDPDVPTQSVWSLIGPICRILRDFRALPGHENCFKAQDYSNCSSYVRNLATTVIKERGFPTEKHKTFMAGRRAKLGLDDKK